MLWLLLILPAIALLFVALWQIGERSLNREIKRLIEEERAIMQRLEAELLEAFPGLEKYWKETE